MFNMVFYAMIKDTCVLAYVFPDSHLKVKGYAGFKGIYIPDAYEKIINAGLKALGYDVAAMQ